MNEYVHQVESLLIPVQAEHRLNENKLQEWLRRGMPGLGSLISVKQFRGGSSNPTYLIEGANRVCVLRKQPPGELLPSAHALDREYRVLDALRATNVPVPKVIAYCDDDSVLGKKFYLMELLSGRIFFNPKLEECPELQRKLIHTNFAQVLAYIHRIDWQKKLEGFGKPQNYLRRQIRRWSSQFESSGLQSNDMNALTAWVEAHIPDGDEKGDECTLVHGDYRLGNILFDQSTPKVIGVLDWELATIGHPLADLAYSCLAWRLPVEMNGLMGHADVSLCSEQDYISAYCSAMGRPALRGFEFFIAFALFRWAAILAGVYRRALDGTASNARSEDVGNRFQQIARLGRQTFGSA